MGTLSLVIKILSSSLVGGWRLANLRRYLYDLIDRFRSPTTGSYHKVENEARDS